MPPASIQSDSARFLSCRHLTSLFVAVVSLLLPRPAMADDELRAVQRQFNQNIRPLLETHCYGCHTGDAADAGLDLSGYETIDQLLHARKTWEKVRVRVAAGEMPPADADPLAPDSNRAVLNWIDHLLDSVDCEDIQPGTVTLRRLNRTEYQNTIGDLLGIDYHPAADFPGDDVGYGFDNIADVLSLPPILMEKYLGAAETITAQAILDPDRPPLDRRLAGYEFDPVRGSGPTGTNHVLSTQGVIRVAVDVPQRGVYELNVRAHADQAGPEPARLSIVVDERTEAERVVEGTADDPTQLKLKLEIEPGKRSIGIGFLNDYYDPKQPPGEQDRNLHVAELHIRGPIGPLPDFHHQWIGERPDGDQPQSDRARKILQQFVSRAYRRPATDAEVDRLLELYQSGRELGDSYEASIRFAMQAVLVSPHFLYKMETPLTSGTLRNLNDHELATSLSYFFWSTMPDQELLDLAAAGRLQDPAVYKAQLERLRLDPQASALVENFAAQWLQLRSLEDFKPDPDLFPGVDGQLRRDMATETKRVIAELIERDASVLELLEADFTFLNQRLARHYGVEGIAGDEFQRVSPPPGNRLGLLSQASILTLTSNPTRTSPVKRGKWIMENLLGDEPPPPDPTAMQLEDQAELTGTLRQRMEQHRADPNCAVCHRVMDELGFALENYDAVGRWRETDEELPIDARGELPDGTQFVGAAELQATIRQQMQAKFVRCLTEKMLTYALGRGLEYYDECAIDDIIEHLNANQYRFSALLDGIALSEPFRMRRRSESQGEPE